jgi:hypothetical protein
METKKYHMITFYSEGRPKDNGLNLKNQAERLKEDYSKYVDSFTLYTPSILKSLGHPLIDYSKDPNFIMKYNAGYNAVGLGYWRPLIILLKLQEMEFGDILYQQDCNVFKYPQILKLGKNIKKLCDCVLKDNDFFVAYHNNNILIRKCCKGDLINKMSNGDPQWYLNRLMVRTSHFICRKTELSMRLVTEWLANCTTENLSPNSNMNYPGFSHHTAEQSVFNMLYYKYVKDEIVNPINTAYSTECDLNVVYKKIMRIQNNAELGQNDYYSNSCCGNV